MLAKLDFIEIPDDSPNLSQKGNNTFASKALIRLIAVTGVTSVILDRFSTLDIAIFSKGPRF